nr:hypothetical protein Iba_scaffold11342.2CG0040 [Ipomoea batatas]
MPGSSACLARQRLGPSRLALAHHTDAIAVAGKSRRLRHEVFRRVKHTELVERIARIPEDSRGSGAVVFGSRETGDFFKYVSGRVDLLAHEMFYFW